MDWFEIVMGLLGGLALFLLGLDQLAGGLQGAAGESMKYILAKLTRNRFLGALTGAVVTAVLNSSSVTTVLVVGFISAGVMTLAQSISVIMGANIGSTATAQIVAFNVTRYALAMIGVGFAMHFVAKRDKVRQSGAMIMGLGMVFFGMGVMGDSMAPLREYQPFIDLMAKMEVPILGIFVGAAFTGLVQSSAATMGLAIVMASEGLITLPAGIALALGANIGTCATALLAAIGKPREAQRAAAAHVLFNVIGVLLWVGFIDQLADIAVRLSPTHDEMAGAERLAAELPRQLANANTLFNIINTLAFLPFTGLLAKLVTRLLPDKAVDERDLVKPRYLDPELTGTPALALDRVRMELGHMGEILRAMWQKAVDAFESRDHRQFGELEQMDDQVDALQAEIVGYLGEIRQREMTDKESEDFLRLMTTTTYLESIGDVFEVSLVEQGRRMVDQGIEPSATMVEILHELGASVSAAVEAAVQATVDEDGEAARRVVAFKDQINRQIERFLEYQAAKLAPSDPQRAEIFRVEIGLVDALKRIYTLAKRIAKQQVEQVELAA